MKNIHDDLSSLDLGVYEARDMAQKSASLETDICAQRYALIAVHATIGWTSGILPLSDYFGFIGAI